MAKKKTTKKKKAASHPATKRTAAKKKVATRKKAVTKKKKTAKKVAKKKSVKRATAKKTKVSPKKVARKTKKIARKTKPVAKKVKKVARKAVTKKAKAVVEKTKPVAKKAETPKRAVVDPARQIAEIDRHVLDMIRQRARLVQRLYKSNRKDEATSLCKLSDTIVTKLEARGVDPLPQRTAKAIFRELMSGCRALVQPTRVAFLGPDYSFTHIAAVRHFGQGVQFVPIGCISAVFEEINRGHSDFGLVPIENSTVGRVSDTLDMFTRLPVRICGEVEMRIQHTLLGKGERHQIREVYSKAQALSQCHNWLAKHLPSARTIEVTSTTTAAQLAREKPGAAAIASREAGLHYGLDILAENIEDNPTNTTRFAVIGKKSAARTGHDRTAILFQVEHRPGTLAEAMNIFKRYSLNLTWIESFPDPNGIETGEGKAKNANRSYFFFIETEGHEDDPSVKKALETLSRKAARIDILGSYPVVQLDK